MTITVEKKVPEIWAESAPPKVIKIALDFGLLKIGYSLENYLVDAVKEGGYETVCIWGIQGSGKSSYMLQMGYWIYKDWDKVLSSLVFKPNDFVKRLKSIPVNRRTPCLLWDDIGVHYPSSTFKTDIKQYEAIDSAWAAVRTKCNIIIMTIPLIDRLAKNIKDNVTFEVFLGRNQKVMIRRLFHLPGLNRMESNFFKILLEKPYKINLYDVPTDVFKEYWELRLRLTEEALDRLDKTVEEEDLKGYVPVLDASLELNVSPNTLQQMISRGIVQGKKIKGVLCIKEEELEKLKMSEKFRGQRPRGKAYRFKVE
ncbi:MAG: hypothetical protein DRO12_03780 [Thermoprotei archaeon]|nr:MAG: hypothetical protein DRO12_03780 [Thermoprotei archaeon]